MVAKEGSGWHRESRRHHDAAIKGRPRSTRRTDEQLRAQARKEQEEASKIHWKDPNYEPTRGMTQEQVDAFNKEYDRHMADMEGPIGFNADFCRQQIEAIKDWNLNHPYGPIEGARAAGAIQAYRDRIEDLKPTLTLTKLQKVANAMDAEEKVLDKTVADQTNVHDWAEWMEYREGLAEERNELVCIIATSNHMTDHELKDEIRRKYHKAQEDYELKKTQRRRASLFVWEQAFEGAI